MAEYTVVWSGRESLDSLTPPVVETPPQAPRRTLAACASCAAALWGRRYQDGTRLMWCSRCLKNKHNDRKRARYQHDEVFRQSYKQREYDRYWTVKHRPPAPTIQCARCYATVQRSSTLGPVEIHCLPCKRIQRNTRRRRLREASAGTPSRGPYRRTPPQAAAD